MPCHHLAERPQNPTTIMPPPLPSAVVEHIISLAQEGHSITFIKDKTSVSRSQISKIRSAHCPEVPKAKGGRPSLLTPTTVRHATRLIETGKADTATEVHRLLQDTFLEGVSVNTIRRALKRIGMRAVTKKKRPMLSKRHKAKRLEFARSVKDWTVEDWKRVVGQMRPESTGWGPMGSIGCGRRQERG